MADFSASAKQRIRRGIRAIESGRFEETSTQLDRPAVGGEFLLARAYANYVAGEIGTFLLLIPGNSKGSETASSETVTAYVREGTCAGGADYILIEAVLSDDAAFEVLNPEHPLILATADAFANAQDTTAASFTRVDNSETVSAALTDGMVIEGENYYLLSDLSYPSENGYTVFDPTLFTYGVANADASQDDPISVSVYNPRNVLSPEDTGEDIDCTVRINDTISTGDRVAIQWSSGASIKRWTAFTDGSGGSSRSLSGVAGSFGDAGDTINFTTAIGTKAALVPAGLVLSGETYLLVWTDGDHYEVANPELAVTATCSGFITALSGSGSFTVSGNTITVNITRGLCLSGKDYGVVWADSGGWAVIDPEMDFIGIPTAHKQAGTTATFTVYSGTKGSETSTGSTADGLVRHGIVFTGHRYKVAWIDRGWEVSDPTLSVTVQCDALAQAASSATMSIYYGTPGSESDTSENCSAYLHRGIVFASKKYRCSYIDNGWVCDNPSLTVRGKVSSDVASGASGTLNIYTGTFGSETQPTGSPTVSSVKNDSDCTVRANKMATAEWVDDNGGWQFEIARTA